MSGKEEEGRVTTKATDASTGPFMTEELIRAQCKKHQGFTTPELNEKLYLHHFGFSKIAHLGPYTGCTVLYLSHNAISDLNPLAGLVNLNTLYISNNGLTSCVSLPRLPALRTLDVSNNLLTSLEGIANGTPDLECLLAAHNCLEGIHDGTVAQLSVLVSLDVSHNRIADPKRVLPAIGVPTEEAKATVATTSTHSQLRTCIFSGNQFVRHVHAYRKRMIASLPELRFLDEYPVFPEERERAEAFAWGGQEAEKAARADIEARQQREKEQQFAYFDTTLEEPRLRRVEMGEKTTPSHYYMEHRADATGAATALDDENDPVYIPS